MPSGQRLQGAAPTKTARTMAAHGCRNPGRQGLATTGVLETKTGVRDRIGCAAPRVQHNIYYRTLRSGGVSNEQQNVPVPCCPSETLNRPKGHFSAPRLCLPFLSLRPFVFRPPGGISRSFPSYGDSIRLAARPRIHPLSVTRKAHRPLFRS